MKYVLIFFKFTILISIVVAFMYAGSCMVKGEMPIPPKFGDVGKKKGLKSRLTGLKLIEKNFKGEVLKISSKEADVTDIGLQLATVLVNFQPLKQQPVTLVADRGTLYNKTDNAEFRGNVVLRSPKPFTLETESLDWDSVTRDLHTMEKIRFTSGNTLVLGTGVRINMDKQDVTVMKDVDAKFR